MNEWKIQKKENLHLRFSDEKKTRDPKFWGGVDNLNISV